MQHSFTHNDVATAALEETDRCGAAVLQHHRHIGKEGEGSCLRTQ